MPNSEVIKKRNSNSWRNIWIIYNANQKFYNGTMFGFTVVVNIIILTTITLIKTDLFIFISQLIDVYLNILPNLLGFNLGAYALLIGLSSSNMLSKLTSNIESGYTFYQKASSVFAMSIVVQASTLTFTFILKQIKLIQDHSSCINQLIPQNFANLINFTTIILLNFFGIYSLLLILMLVKNIFGLSQTANFLSGLEELKNKNRKNIPRN